MKFHKLAGLKAPKAYYFQAETRVGGKKITFDVKQLAAHLKEIIHLNKLSKEAATRSGSIVRKENWQDASKAEKNKVLEKLTKERNKRQVSEAKTLISDAIEDPSILVGKTFKHNIQETNDDTPEWYDGKIIGIDKIPKDKSKTTYLVTYDLDGDDQFFSMPMIVDLRGGKVVFV